VITEKRVLKELKTKNPGSKKKQKRSQDGHLTGSRPRKPGGEEKYRYRRPVPSCIKKEVNTPPEKRAC